MAFKDANATLAEVAKEAGVSLSTASKALNKYPRINARTRAKVYNAVKSLGYDTRQIDRRVQALSKMKEDDSELAMLLCPQPGERSLMSMDFFKEIYDGAQSCVAQLGCAKLSLSTWEADEGAGKRNEATLKRLAQADGLIVTGAPSSELLETLLKSCRNVVVAGNPCEASVNTIETDDIGGGMLAARYLIDKGFESIGFLDGPARIKSWTARRMGAMIESVQKLGFERFSWRCAKSSETKDMAATLKEWLASGECPEALIVSHSVAVAAVELALLAKGMECPRDLSVVAFDQFSNPSGEIVPTRLETYPRQLGLKAAQRIAEMIARPHLEESPHRTLVPMRLVEGNSVKDKLKA